MIIIQIAHFARRVNIQNGRKNCGSNSHATRKTMTVDGGRCKRSDDVAAIVSTKGVEKRVYKMCGVQ